MKWYIYVVAIVFSASVAHADFPLKDYKTLKDNRGFRTYLVGVAKGIFWSNVYLRHENRARLFCMPPKLALDEEVILSLIDQEVRQPSPNFSYNEETPIELIMVLAFVQKFPCEGR